MEVAPLRMSLSARTYGVLSAPYVVNSPNTSNPFPYCDGSIPGSSSVPVCKATSRNTMLTDTESATGLSAVPIVSDPLGKTVIVVTSSDVSWSVANSS